MRHSTKKNTYHIVYISMFVSLLIILSQIQVPLIGGIPITLQTLGVLLIGNILGSKSSAVAILIYLLLGIVGVPVFSSFRSGIQELLSPTGGFLIGFIPLVIISGLASNKKFFASYIYNCFGLLSCYLCGILMYYRIYHIIFIPTLPIMFIKDLIMAFFSIYLAKEIKLRVAINKP